LYPLVQTAFLAFLHRIMQLMNQFHRQFRELFRAYGEICCNDRIQSLVGPLASSGSGCSKFLRAVTGLGF